MIEIVPLCIVAFVLILAIRGSFKLRDVEPVKPCDGCVQPPCPLHGPRVRR